MAQVFFGVLGDKLGRKKIYLITLMLMIFATIAQALSASVVKGASFSVQNPDGHLRLAPSSLRCTPRQARSC